MRRRLLLALAALPLAAGCGGTSDYSAAETRSCLEEAGLAVTSPAGHDIVAQTGTGGAFRTRIDGNGVTLVFSGDEEEAARTAQGYRRTPGAPSLDDLLFQERNVVQLWLETPSTEQRERVGACLK